MSKSPRRKYDAPIVFVLIAVAVFLLATVVEAVSGPEASNAWVLRMLLAVGMTMIVVWEGGGQ